MKRFTLEIDDASYDFEPAMWEKLFEALQLVMNRMAVGYHKYHVDRNLPLLECDEDTIAFIRQRLAMYGALTEREVCECVIRNELRVRHGSTCFVAMHGAKLNTGNLENLLDVVNGCLVEFIRPAHHKAHFRAQSSAESPGLVGKEE